MREAREGKGARGEVKNQKTTTPPLMTPHASPLTPHAKGTVLGFDFGEKRIGVAVGERALGIAHPLTTIALSDNVRRFATIAALLKEWQPSLLVVGLPTHMDGTDHDLTRRCRRFAQQLTGRFGLPVALVDERLTSAVAEDMLREASVATRKHKPLLDQVAAQQILQSYFDTPAAHAAPHSEPGAAA
jgi:putative Holliday junction resolvase